MPMAEENFAIESNIALARLGSFVANQYPAAFAVPGNVGASPIPNKIRAPNRLFTPSDTAAANDAAAQIIVLTMPTRLTPNRSSSNPEGSCNAAYGQLYVLDKTPNSIGDIPNAS